MSINKKRRKKYFAKEEDEDVSDVSNTKLLTNVNVNVYICEPLNTAAAVLIEPRCCMCVYTYYVVI